jgi:hypothetical protein
MLSFCSFPLHKPSSYSFPFFFVNSSIPSLLSFPSPFLYPPVISRDLCGWNYLFSYLGAGTKIWVGAVECYGGIRPHTSPSPPPIIGTRREQSADNPFTLCTVFLYAMLLAPLAATLMGWGGRGREEVDNVVPIPSAAGQMIGAACLGQQDSQYPFKRTLYNYDLYVPLLTVAGGGEGRSGCGR